MTEEEVMNAYRDINKEGSMIYTNLDPWISIKDKLPELGVSVLVYQFEDKVNNGIYVAWIEKLGIEDKPIWQYSWCCGCFVPREVTHWRDLPEPPRKQDNE